MSEIAGHSGRAGQLVNVENKVGVHVKDCSSSNIQKQLHNANADPCLHAHCPLYKNKAIPFLNKPTMTDCSKYNMLRTSAYLAKNQDPLASLNVEQNSSKVDSVSQVQGGIIPNPADSRLLLQMLQVVQGFCVDTYKRMDILERKIKCQPTSMVSAEVAGMGVNVQKISDNSDFDTSRPLILKPQEVGIEPRYVVSVDNSNSKIAQIPNSEPAVATFSPDRVANDTLEFQGANSSFNRRSKFNVKVCVVNIRSKTGFKFFLNYPMSLVQRRDLTLKKLYWFISRKRPPSHLPKKYSLFKKFMPKLVIANKCLKYATVHNKLIHAVPNYLATQYVQQVYSKLLPKNPKALFNAVKGKIFNPVLKTICLKIFELSRKRKGTTISVPDDSGRSTYFGSNKAKFSLPNGHDSLSGPGLRVSSPNSTQLDTAAADSSVLTNEVDPSSMLSHDLADLSGLSDASSLHEAGHPQVMHSMKDYIQESNAIAAITMVTPVPCRSVDPNTPLNTQDICAIAQTDGLKSEPSVRPKVYNSSGISNSKPCSRKKSVRTEQETNVSVCKNTLCGDRDICTLPPAGDIISEFSTECLISTGINSSISLAVSNSNGMTTCKKNGYSQKINCVTSQDVPTRNNNRLNTYSRLCKYLHLVEQFGAPVEWPVWIENVLEWDKTLKYLFGPYLWLPSVGEQAPSKLTLGYSRAELHSVVSRLHAAIGYNPLDKVLKNMRIVREPIP